MNFERGQDPKASMGIGIYGMHRFKDDFEACDFIVPILPTILGIKDFLELDDNCLYSGTSVWGKLAKYTVDCILVEDGNFRKHTYEIPDGSLMGLLIQKIEDRLILAKLFEMAKQKGYKHDKIRTK